MTTSSVLLIAEPGTEPAIALGHELELELGLVAGPRLSLQ